METQKCILFRIHVTVNGITPLTVVKGNSTIGSFLRFCQATKCVVLFSTIYKYSCLKSKFFDIFIMIWTQTGDYQLFFLKRPNLKFHESQSSGSCADNADRQTAITKKKKIGAFSYLCECDSKNRLKVSVMFSQYNWPNLTHWGRVTQICVFTLNCARRMKQTCLFNTRLFSLHNKLNL